MDQVVAQALKTYSRLADLQPLRARRRTAAEENV